MLKTGKFPKVMKISRITPIKKPRKSPTNMLRFRLIRNLQTYKKVIETVIKNRMTVYFEEIIL